MVREAVQTKFWRLNKIPNGSSDRPRAGAMLGLQGAQVTEKLYEATQRLLAARPRDLSLAEVARGAKVKPSWLSAFSRDEIPDPGVHKVQRLYNYLSQANGEGN